jgi:hypothetical protein
MDSDKGAVRLRWRAARLAVVASSVLVGVLVGMESAAPAKPLQSASPMLVSGNAFRDCTVAETHLLVARFIRAFNVGAGARLDALWAKDDHDGDAGTPSFQWYSTSKPGDRAGREAADRSTLIRYFAARHRRGERLRLVYMSTGGNANGYFHFAFQIHRRARDMRRPGVFEGKGAAICSRFGAQLAVWSVGSRVTTN